MSKIKTPQMSMTASLVVAILAFGSFAGAAAIVTKNQFSLAPITFAEDGEDSGDDNNDDDKDDEKDDEDDGDDDKDKAKEELKKKTERARESAKKQAERDGANDDEDEDSDEDEGNDDGDDDADENEGDDIDEDEDDDNGMYQDRDKTLSKLQEKIAEAEKEILEKQAEGVDVTVALARLALAKAAIGSVNGAFDASNLEEVKRLAQEARKLTHFAKEEDLHDAKEVSEDAAKVSKRITQAYGKIALLEAVGGDGNPFKAPLASYEADLATLKATIAAGGYDLAAMESALKILERKVKSIKGSVEGAIYALGGTDGKYDDDYEEETDDVVEHLNDVAEIEDDNIGRAIRSIASDHKDSAKKVSENIANIDKHNLILQTLFGTSKSDLNDLEQEIVSNNARVEALLQAIDAIEDQDIRSILLDQVATLREQSSKLELFVNGQRNRASAFGWFFNLF